MNKVILVGRLSRDPESRVTSNNLEITRFSLACNSEVTARNGENPAEFINCVAFGNTASVISKYCVKGTSISVIGRIHNGSYTAKDGTTRYTTEVNVESFEFAGTSNRNQNATGNSNYSNNFNNNNNNNYSAPAPAQNEFSAPSESNFEDPYKNLGDDITLSSDDLPF